MNHRQRLVLVAAAVLVVLTGIWVPWKSTATARISSWTFEVERPCGFHFAFGSPKVDARALFDDLEWHASEEHIDTTRMVAQWLGITLVAVFLSVAFKD